MKTNICTENTSFNHLHGAGGGGIGMTYSLYERAWAGGTRRGERVTYSTLATEHESSQECLKNVKILVNFYMRVQQS